MVRTSRELARRMEEHGQKTYPEECCGILLGSTDGDETVILDVVEIDNLQEDNRRRRFLITPKQYLQAERAASERNLQLLGFYHSHPDHPAIPSEFDREHALPWFTYIVLSVAYGEAKVMTAWFLSESRDRFNETPLSIETTRPVKIEEERGSGR
ncbi:MAG: M67 family metallopeptidase [Bacteroidetes bacterium]|nr:M67 family metallopeptidase [Bacteroidota bacterium]